MTLVRWDTGYYRNVGPIKHRIVDYRNIWGYVRDLYSIPDFARYLFVNERPPQKDRSLFRRWEDRIQPQIDYVKLFSEPNDRKKLSRTPDEVYLRHPEGETYEEYAGPISKTVWNDPSWEVRNPSNQASSPLSADASVNPLKGLL